MLYIKQYVWVCDYVYIDFNVISCILCDMCMTELFALCVLYFVRDDKIKMFNHIFASFEQYLLAIGNPFLNALSINCALWIVVQKLLTKTWLSLNIIRRL